MARSCLAVLAVLFCLTACSAAPAEKREDLTVWAVKCGKADAFVLTCGGACMILDAGETDDADKILSILKDRDIDTVDVLLITHFDKDHVGGAAQLVSGAEIEEVVEPDYKEKSDEVKAYRLALGDIPARVVRSGEILRFDLGTAKVTVHPTSLKDPGDNDVSLIVEIVHGDRTFLFAGDAEEARLREWLSGHTDAYDFLKAPHHGRWNDACRDFYTTVSPDLCVITASEKNPADERTLAILDELGADVYLTQNGTIRFVSDGKTIRAER